MPSDVPDPADDTLFEGEDLSASPETGGTLHAVEVDEALAGQRLDKGLTLALPHLTRTRIKALIEGGAVRLGEGVASDPAAKLGAGERVTLLEPPAAPAEPAPEPMPLSVVFEDEALIVIDKPAGLVVHPAPGHASGTLVNGLLAHCGASLSGIGGVARPGIVHRIDKDTSGLLVVAKTDAAHRGLAEQFAEHSLERSYWALVRGAPRQIKGHIDKPIGRSASDRKKMAIRPQGGRHAITHFTVLERYPADQVAPALASLIECRLETGRTHQIRVHLADLGVPLLGDPLYGRGRSTLPAQAPETVRHFVRAANRQALHARTLGFLHPISGEALRFTSAVPDDLLDLQAALKTFGA